MPSDLTFDEHPVTRRQIKITRAGDGLSEALKIEDVDLEAGERVTVILRGIVEGAAFKPDKDADVTDGYIRIDNIVAKSARIAPDGFSELEGLMDEHDAQIAEMHRLEEEEKKGVTRMPFDGTEDDAAQAAEDGQEAPLGSPRNPHGAAEAQ